MTPKLLTALGVTLALLLPAVAAADGDVQVGREKAYTCLGCHGVSGYRNAYPSYNVPRLGGQHAEYIVSALQAYKAGDRSHPTMQGISQTLSEEDMEDIAAYFEQAGQVEE